MIDRYKCTTIYIATIQYIQFHFNILRTVLKMCDYLIASCISIGYLITSLAKEVMFLVALVSLSVCLSVCLFVCGQHYSKSYERIGMKFYGRVLSSTRKN